MGWTNKSKSGNEGWGMGLLLVFFPEDDHDSIIDTSKKDPHLFSSSSTTSSSSSSVHALLRRSNSTHLLARAQSVISICALLIFTTLLLFTLSTFEPTASPTPRRHLSTVPSSARNSPPGWPLNWLPRRPGSMPGSDSGPLPHALQGMGALFRRGKKAMSDLVVAHVGQSVTANELRLFLRLFHRSALTFRSDLLFIFPKKAASLAAAIREENDSFSRILERFEELNRTGVDLKLSFDPMQFVKPAKKDKEVTETIWGRKNRSNVTAEGESDSTRLSYGSVVGFEVDELDPEDSLAGFLDHVPMSMRRWACYPMLLGRVRRNFKHVMLVDVKEMVLLGDPFGRVRSQSPDFVLLSSTQPPGSGRHGRRNSEKTHSGHHRQVTPALVLGGARGVRRLSNAMLREIARAAMQHKRKNWASESALFDQLVGNEFVLKNVEVATDGEPVPELSSFVGSGSKPAGCRLSFSKHAVGRRGNSNIDFNSIIMKHICSFPIDSLVYSDCSN